MFDFIGSRMQKAIAKATKKTQLKEEDILEITRDIRLALLEADVNLKVVKDFISAVKEKTLTQEVMKQLNPGQQMVKIVKEELTQILGNKVREFQINKKPYVIMMTGLQGGGKTTTVAKLAAYLRKKQNLEKILVVAADVYRPAAIQQLVSLAKQIGVDYYEKGDSKDVDTIVKEALDKAHKEKYDLVIVDTAGRLSIDEKLMDELVRVKSIIKPNDIFFIADALSGQDIINVATTFNDKLKLTGSIITKLDSDARGGAALSIRYLLNIPIVFIGTGEKVSNIDLFYPDRMAERILGMGDVLSLIEKAEEVIDEKKSKKMINKMIQGNFDLDDLLDNLRQVKKLGSIQKILKFLPGNLKIDADRAEKADEKLKLFEILISSMTMQERKDPKLLKNASRKERILKGSGRSVQEYNLLVNEFEQMRKRMKDFSSKVKGGEFDPSNFGM